jgi:hypothetical protein
MWSSTTREPPARNERHGGNGLIERQIIRATVPPRPFVELETCGSRRKADRLYFGGRGGLPARSQEATTAPDERRDRPVRGREATRDRYVQPTLRQAWPRECPRPQCAFKMSMFNVSCNSHYFTQLAALFIDTRAE